MNTIGSFSIEQSSAILESVVGNQPVFGLLILLVKVTVALAVAWAFHFVLGQNKPIWRRLMWRTTSVGLLLLIGMAVLPPLISIPWQVGELSEVDANTVSPNVPIEMVINPSDSRGRPTSPDESTLSPQSFAPVNQPDVIGSSSSNFQSKDKGAEKPTLNAQQQIPIEPVANYGIASSSVERALTLPEKVGLPKNQAAANVVTVSQASQEAWANLPMLVVLIWSAGFLLMLARIAAGVFHLNCLQRASTPASEALQNLAENNCIQLQLKTTPRVLVVGKIETPCLAGLLRPVILLPDNMFERVENRTDTACVIAHECAHMECNDLHWNALLQALTAVLWFHPLAWRMRLAHVDACDSVVDARVSDVFGNRERYCQTLASLALRVQAATPSVSLGMARKSTVRKRIEQLRSGLSVFQISRENAFLFVAASLIVAVPLGGLTISRIAAAPAAPNSSVSREPADGELLDDTKVRCGGQVTDAAGKHIADAKVLLLLPGGGDHRYVTVQRFDQLATRTDQEGRFEFQFDCNDQRYLEKGDFKLLVYARGYATELKSAALTRLMVRLPFDFQLTSARPFQLELVDHDGQPIADASIHPARINGIRIPTGVLPELNAVTDATGKVTWNHLDPANLNQIYMKTESHGNQQLLFVKTSDGWQSQALVQGMVEFKPRYPQGWDRNKIAGRKLFLATSPSRTYDHDGPDTMAWRILEFDKRGDLPNVALASGRLSYFLVDNSNLDIVPEKTGSVFLPTLKPGAELRVDLNYVLDTRIEITLQIVDDSGRPLPNIALGSLFTDAKGQFKTKIKKDAPPSGQIFPADPTGTYCTPPVGFRYARNAKSDDLYQTLVMPKSQLIKGVTFDETGTRVAGAKIEYEFGQLRFENSGHVVSDESGEFQLRGIPRGTVVSLSAEKANLGTARSQEVHNVAGQTGYAELVLFNQPFAKIDGRILDTDKQPVKDVAVQIGKALVFEKGEFSGESLTSSPLFADQLTVYTDEMGRFEFPKTRCSRNRYRIKTASDRYHDLESRFVGEDGRIKNGRVNLGDFTLVKKAGTQSRTLRVVDSTGQPMPNIEVTFLSYRAGRKQFITDADGGLTASLPGTGQLILLKTVDRRIHIQWLDANPAEQTIQFQNVGESSLPTANRLHKKSESFSRLSAELLAELDTPTTEETYYQQASYFQAQSLVDFAQFRKTMLDPACPYKYRNEFWSSNSFYEFRHDAKAANKRLKELKDDARSKAIGFSFFAMESETPLLREDLFAEAVAEIQKLNGVDKWRTICLVAEHLILSGHALDAADLLESIWGSELSVEKVKTLPRHERRNILPVMAVIDAETVLQLIERTSSKMEAREWIPQALVWLATADFEKYQTLDKDKYHADVAFGMLLILERLERDLLEREPLLQLARNLYEESGPKSVRSELLLALARHADSSEEREKWIRAAVASKMTARESILSELARFKEIAPEEINQLVYAAVARGPEKYRVDGFGQLAALLAFKDPALARKLLEPVFSDLSWLHNYSKGLNFIRNYPLRSTLWIDPHWTKSLAKALVEKYSVDHANMKVETYGAIIEDACFLIRCLQKFN